MMNKRGFGLFFFMCYSGYNPPVPHERNLTEDTQMNSLVKREVNIAITPHIELIKQLLIDSLEVVKHRASTSKTSHYHFLRDNAIYYRVMRATGHTAALKQIVSNDFYSKTGIEVLALYDKEQRMFKDFPTIDDRNNVITKYDFSNKHHIISNRNIRILIITDEIGTSRVEETWNMIAHNIERLFTVELVVFLG